MVRYTPKSLDELRNKIDLVEVLESHISLKKAGSAYKALCPFHEERSPSFHVQKGDRHYHCFGCGAHGDAIQFLMDHMKMSFKDAIQQLADRFQVHLESVTKEEENAPHIDRNKIKKALELAHGFFQWNLLHTQEGKKALEYLFGRAIPVSFIQKFGLGYAPKQEGYLSRFLRSEGCSIQDMMQAGLIVEGNGRFRDFFAERITFPILDAQSVVIGFSARKFLPDTYGGKYINTQETELFKKSRVLFGLPFSRKRIAKERQVIIVEGQLDALRLIHHGFNYTVAPLGTAFTDSHAQELLRLGIKRAFLLLDGDSAGRTASMKIGHILQKRGVEVLVCSLQSQEDPDLLLVKSGPLTIVEKLLSAKDYLEFLYTHLSLGIRLDVPAEKNQILQQIIERIRDFNDSIMVHESLKKLAKIAQVPEELLGVQGSEKPISTFKKPVSLKADTIDPDLVLETDLLRWLLVCMKEKKELLSLCKKNISTHDFRVDIAKKIYSELLQEKDSFDLLSLAQDVDEDDVSHFLTHIFSKKINREKVHEQFIETLKRMKERNWLLEREDIKMKIHSGKANEQEVLDLVRKFDELKNRVPQVVT